MDSSIATDPRFKLLAADLGWSLRELAGTCFFVWLACYERRSERLTVREANACAERAGFAEAIVDAGLAHLDDDGCVVFHGIEERIAFLEKQAEKGRKGGRARGYRRQANAKQMLSHTVSKSSAYSPAPAPAQDLAPSPSPSPSPSQEQPVGVQGEGSLAAGPAAAQPSSGRKRGKSKKPSDPTPAEQASLEVVIAKLNKATGREYSPDTKEHTARLLRLLRDGYSELDLRLVIWSKTAEWRDKPEMEPFLRPSTLFGPKNFAEYVVQARAEWAKEQGARNGHGRYADGPQPGAVLAVLAEAQARREDR